MIKTRNTQEKSAKTEIKSRGASVDQLTAEELAAREARAAFPKCWLYVTKDNYGVRDDNGEIIPCYCLRGLWTPETRSVSTGIYLTELEAWRSHTDALELAKSMRKKT